MAEVGQLEAQPLAGRAGGAAGGGGGRIIGRQARVHAHGQQVGVGGKGLAGNHVLGGAELHGDEGWGEAGLGEWESSGSGLGLGTVPGMVC